MSAIIRVEDISKHTGEEVQVEGWVYNRTDKGKLCFLLVRDGSGFVQCVAFKGDLPEALFDQIMRLPQESSVVITGVVREDKRAPGIPGGYEVGIKDLKVVQVAEADYPMALKDHGVDFALDNRHLWIRMQSQWAILRVRAAVMAATREWLDTNGFLAVDTPILTPAACEGTTTLFPVDYFEEQAFLTQSGQLYIEATAMALGKVYSFGPTFRAEKSKTRRHLTEFWMVEPEMAFAELDDIMNLAEGLISFIVGRVLETRRHELVLIGRDISQLEKIAAPFPRISYDEAVKILQQGHAEGKLETKFEWGGDFGSPDETFISAQFDRPVMVHRYPAEVKAFYMEPDPTNPKLALCVDVLAPEGYGEIIGGSQRIASYELLKQRIQEHNLPEAAFKWYLDLRKYGGNPHGGFGMGIERAVAWICGLEHVRETIPFPRMLYRLYP
jgi:asparaginyl-tRNA synthetase